MTVLFARSLDGAYARDNASGPESVAAKAVMTIADDGRRSLWADGRAEALWKVRRRQRDLELDGTHQSGR